MQENVMKKAMVNFKLYDVTDLEANDYNTHISRSKGNQAMRSGQLIEYNMRNIFLEHSYKKCGGEACPRPFYKISKLSIPLDQ